MVRESETPAHHAISAVKITDPIDLARFQVMGFQSPF